MTTDDLLDRLFTNGRGEVADRLVLTSRDGRDLGGLCREAVADYLTSFTAGFYPGQRVRLTEHGVRQLSPRDERSRRATVVSTWWRGGWRYVRVLRDGHKSKQTYFHGFWEPIPVAELARDETAEMLVRAYQAEKLPAALALADHLIELHGGTKKERGL